MKIAMVLPYFGAFPEYAPLFFQSCAANPDYTWLILTDSGVPCDLPNNVKIISMTFQRCRELIQNKFDFPISLKTPQKLCDYKCAYGYLFKSYLSGFDFWGHCDMDQIFGELGRFVTPELLERYDKLYTLGHFTLYRNKPENNVRFMEPINGASRYREVFSTPGSCGFDPSSLRPLARMSTPTIPRFGWCGTIKRQSGTSGKQRITACSGGRRGGCISTVGRMGRSAKGSGPMCTFKNAG